MLKKNLFSDISVSKPSAVVLETSPYSALIEDRLSSSYVILRHSKIFIDLIHGTAVV